MNAKEYLSQAIWMDQIINNKLEQLESLKSLTMKVTSTFTEERVCGGSSEISKMESTIVKVIDLENEINDDIDRLIDLKKDIIDAVSKMSDLNHQLLLEMRYLGGKNWDEIAESMGYDRSTIFRIHGKSLKEIDKIKKMRLNAIECDYVSML